MAGQVKYGGRPRREPVASGDRVHLGFRVTPKLKARVEAAASASGRSQSQEAESRLEQSFAEEALFSSPRLLRWAIGLANEFHGVGTHAAELVRSEDEPADTSDAWMDDPQALLLASFAAMRALIRDLARHRRSDREEIEGQLRQLQRDLTAELTALGRLAPIEKGEGGEDGSR